MARTRFICINAWASTDFKLAVHSEDMTQRERNESGGEAEAGRMLSGTLNEEDGLAIAHSDPEWFRETPDPISLNHRHRFNRSALRSPFFLPLKTQQIMARLIGRFFPSSCSLCPHIFICLGLRTDQKINK